jgi:hypothetical protein
MPVMDRANGVIDYFHIMIGFKNDIQCKEPRSGMIFIITISSLISWYILDPFVPIRR